MANEGTTARLRRGYGGVIAKDKSGAPLKGIVWNGLQSYPLSYAWEWETGCAKRRIDGLLKMLPELKEAHTIHIDAFHSRLAACSPGR